jgi:hypothetical protein
VVSLFTPISSNKDTKEPSIEEGQTKQWPKEKRTKGSRKLNIGEPY